MFKRITSALVTFVIVCALILFNACEMGVEYRDVIKEVPVEVPVEVPIEVLVEDETRINELIAELNELQSSFELQLAELNEAYNEKVSELQNSTSGNETLLQDIAELHETYQEQLRMLTEAHEIEIAGLQYKLSFATSIEFYELRVYKERDQNGVIKMTTPWNARNYYNYFVGNPGNYAPIQIMFCPANSFEIDIQKSPYVNADIESILRDVKDQFKLAYGYTREGEYITFWFIKALW